MHHRIALALIALTLLAACAGKSPSTASVPCALTPTDSVFLKAGSVYRDCAVTERAQLVNRVAPDFHPSSSMTPTCYSAEIEFVVDPRGSPEPEDVQVVRATDPSFAAAVVASLPRWRYRPALLNGTAVRQIVKEKVAIGSVIVAVPAGQIPRAPAHGPQC
jgi:hypothetical protein